MRAAGNTRGAAIFLGAALAALPAAAQDVAYTGKYASEPEYLSLKKRFPGLKRAAASIVADRLGLGSSNLANIEVTFFDMPRDPRKTVLLAGTNTEVRDGIAIQAISLNLEPHFDGTGTLFVELTHEMTHALLRNILGAARHDPLPQWLREGLALWVAGQGPDRTMLWLCRFADENDPVSLLVNGLDSPNHDARDYVEDYFAFETLEALAGKDGVQGFVRALAEGREWRAALEEASGRKWEAFVVFARGRTESKLQELRPAALITAYRTARVLFDVGKLDQALSGMRDLIETWPDTWASAMAGYYEARTLERMERWEEASNAFKRFRLKEGHATTRMDDALWHEALCLRHVGRGRGALPCVDRLYRDYPYSALVPQALLEAGSWLGSEDRLQVLIDEYPDTEAASIARKRLSGR